MREDLQTGQWTKDPKQEQCPECRVFFTKTTQGHKFCSKKCRNTASRKGVKQRRIESLRAMVQAQEQEIQRQAKILEGMKVLLLDLEGY